MSSLAGLVAALVVAATPSHTARPAVFVTGPSFHLAPLQVLPVSDRRTRTCTLRRQHAQAQAGRVERAMEPVACEQPPRSKVILTFNGGLFGNGR